MSKLSRMAWQIHVMKDPADETKLRVITNNFKLDGLVVEELAYAASPFIGCPGKLEIKIYDCLGTPDQRKALFDHISGLFDKQRRAAGFLTPIHSALHTYWYNVSSTREKFDVRGLKNILNGKPVLYCGAGPSLLRDIGSVRRIIKDKSAFVITGGTGIKVMHDNGLVPDLCLAVDPFMQEVERFDGLSKEWQEQTTLLASASLNPICYEGWQGRLVAAEGLNCMPVGQFVEGAHESLDEGPVGVTTWMLNIIKYLGTKELYLIGTDLCFGEGGETYAGDLDLTASQYVYVPDCEGKATRTNWIFEANFIGDAILEHGYLCYNASKGLRIPNAKVVNLNNVLRDLGKAIKPDLRPWKAAKYSKIRDRLRAFSKELLYTEDHLYDERIKEQLGYKYLIQQYDDIQEYQYWRTGQYNYSLIREVCRKNAELINDILKGKQYTGETIYGHLGSPRAPGECDKIRTGSKHLAEVKNATTSSNNNTGTVSK